MQKTIASIYFSPLVEQRRPSYNGVFKIPVVKKGDPPAFLTIKDHHEITNMPFLFGTSANGKPLQHREPIFGEQIAEDILAHWTKYHPEMTAQCAPGMWVVRDLVHLWDEEDKPILDANGKQESRPATAEERDAMFAEDLAAAQSRQDAWVEAALVRGDIMSEKPAAVQYIPQYCRDAVDYAGRERTWRKGLNSGDIKKCSFCTKPIASVAFKCPYCAEIVDANGYAEHKARQEAAQRDANARIKAERDRAKLQDDAASQSAARIAETNRMHEERKARQAAAVGDGEKLLEMARDREAKIAADREAREAQEALATK